jgi:type I restriction enzyme S subunit
MSSDWSTYRLGDIAITQSGGTPSRSNNSFFNGKIPWVKSGELKDSTIYASEEKISSEAIQLSSAKVFEPNTLLLAMYGATVGKTGILKIRAATNQAVCAIRPKNDDFGIEFLKFYLIFIRPQLLRERYGGAQPNISQTLIQDLQVTLPLLTEQKNIAAVLFKIQQAIEIQESIIEKTRELKKSTQHHVFTNGLRGEKLKETEEIGPIPESWDIRSFGEFATLHRGYDLPVQDRTNGPVPIVGSNGIAGYHNQSKVKGPGVVTGRSGSIGISYYVTDDYWPLNTGLYVEDFHGNDPLYVHYFFQLFNFGQFAAGVSVPTLNRNIVHTVLISVPPIEEQKEIANIFKTIDQKIDLHIAQKSTLQDLFKTMLNKLMTGEIRVKDLDIDVSAVSA